MLEEIRDKTYKYPLQCSHRLFLVKRTLYNEINLFRHVRNTFMLLKHLKQIVTHFFRNPYFIVIIHNRSIKMNTNG